MTTIAKHRTRQLGISEFVLRANKCRVTSAPVIHKTGST